MAMVQKLILAALVLGYGTWLIIQPARHSWAECATVKGIICVPKVH
jgi:hypothetical protein